jgi:hypothetical protein
VIYEERKAIYDAAIAEWGMDAQAGMVQEECAELVVAFSHWMRGRVGPSAVAEEIADVEVMCEQARRLLGDRGDALVDAAFDRKVARLRERVVGHHG